MNTITITGNLVADPELRETTGGTPVCKIRLAVESLGRGKEVGYVDVDSYGASAKAAAETIGKGWKVGVSGRLEIRQYTDKDEVKRTATTVIGHIEFLSRPKGDSGPVPEQVVAGVVAGDEDIAF